MKKVNVFKIMVFLIVFLFSFLLNINKNTIESIDAVCISYDSSINYNNELLTSVIMRDFDFYLTSVLTPNGRAIDVYEIFGELPNDRINYENSRNEEDFPAATMLASASVRYNCHSYAWYSQDINNNNYWMPSPERYYDEYDMSYTEISSNEDPRTGDIICYFDNMGTLDDASDDKNVHSGIVLAYNPNLVINNVCGNSNQVLVVSKWGIGGLYQHQGDYCPYTSLIRNGPADYVKYYRPRTDAIYTLTQSNPTFNESCTTVGTSYIPSDKYEMYELHIDYSSYYKMLISSTYPVNVRLYDAHMQLLINNPTNDYDNGTYSVTINPYLSSGNIYYLRVCYQNALISGTIITHMHNYTYTWQNYMKHNATCTCGDSHLEMHITNGVPISPGSPYSQCLLCGGLALVTINSPGNINDDNLFNIENVKYTPYIYKDVEKRKKYIN